MGGCDEQDCGGFTQALWDLKTAPATFDFAAWLVCVKTLGADHIHFRDHGEIQRKKFPQEIARERFRTIILGLTKLSGTAYSQGPYGSGITSDYHAGTVEALYRKLGRIWKFSNDYPGERGYVTVTLREATRNTIRNSSPAWKEFIRASKRRVVVLPEVGSNPMPFPERMRLYSNADMNFGVNNGPMWLCAFSEAPYRIFNLAPTKDWKAHYKRTGFPEGSQLSFRNDRQEMIWEHDSLDKIMARIDD